MARKRRRYTDEFRASAVVMLESQGYPEKKGALTAVANHLGVSYRTLSRWFRKEQNPPPDHLVREKRGTLEERLTTLLDEFVEEMTVARKDAPLREVSTSFGIVFDKLQMLKGEPTQRHEHISHTERMDRLTTIFDTARSRGSLFVDDNGVSH